MTKCYAYVRVSTAKQSDGASLEAQQEAIQLYAKHHNLTITQWFEEQETAAKTGRPVFAKLVKALKQQRAAGLITHKIDRSARNFRDWAMIGDLADLGIAIHFVTESLDFNSRGGRLAADIQAVIAADYIRNLREESLKGQRMRLKQGIYPYKAPIGYIDTGKGNLKTICPEKGPLVIELFERYATGNYTLHSLAEYITERGLTSCYGNPLSKSHVEKILRNPFYIGKMHVRTTGATYAGKHQPLISPYLYQAAQAVKHKRFGKKMTKHNHLLRGLFTCGHCGGSMIPEQQKGTVYYRCHTAGCGTKTVREERIIVAVENSLQTYRMSPEMHAAVQHALKTVEERLAANSLYDIAELEIEKLKTREAALADKLLDGVFSDALFAQKQSEINDAVLMWERRRQHAQEKQRATKVVQAVIERLDEFHFTFQIAKDERKREIIKQLYSNRTVYEKNVYLEPQKWVETVQDLATVSQCADLIADSRIEEIISALETFSDTSLARPHDEAERA